ncbi:conserved hypothetical protein [Desulfosarcina cetonica]|nr:conserved hypothetical protein [Desulfosarcina cetonica]
MFQIGLEGGQRVFSIGRGDAREPSPVDFGVGLEPIQTRHARLEIFLRVNRRHDLVHHVDGEKHVFYQQGHVGRVGVESLADIGPDRGRAVIGSEGRIGAAGQVSHVDALVHAVGRPSQEHDPTPLFDAGLDLGQHGHFAGGNDFEFAQAEHVLLDHVADNQVAVVARLDAVNLPVELVAELDDIGKILQPPLGTVGGNGQGVFGAGHVGHVLDHRSVIEKFLGDRGHGGHPVAKEDIRRIAGKRGIDKWYGVNRVLGVVTEAFQHGDGQLALDGHAGPGHAGNANFLGGAHVGCGQGQNGSHGDKNKGLLETGKHRHPISFGEGLIMTVTGRHFAPANGYRPNQLTGWGRWLR